MKSILVKLLLVRGEPQELHRVSKELQRIRYPIFSTSVIMMSDMYQGLAVSVFVIHGVC